MVAPRAETIFTSRRTVVGIMLFCPECPPVLGSPLRVETPADYPNTYPLPELVGKAGPLGFIARCDQCGFRVEMHGDRLPTVKMMQPTVDRLSNRDTWTPKRLHDSVVSEAAASTTPVADEGAAIGPDTTR